MIYDISQAKNLKEMWKFELSFNFFFALKVLLGTVANEYKERNF